MLWALLAALLLVVTVAVVRWVVFPPGIRIIPSASAAPGSTTGDEFNGDALARRMWQPDGTGRDVGGDAPFKQDKEAAWFATSNVTVSGGDLVPTIRNQAKELDGKRYPLSSGVVQRTSDQRLEPCSYVEARISVSDCDGCWPAFWQVPFDQWPPEIDTLEYFDTAGQNRPGLQLLRAGPRPVGAHPPMARPAPTTAAGSTSTGCCGTARRPFLLWTATPYPSAGASHSMTELPMMLILNLSVD